ncbi:MAG: SMC family ATPase [Mycobacteriaceae bacterium]
MRLHSLQVTAFGPFAGTETVDFDALGADGLFLLHGETGSGKTTVLDAVAFALFGRVPGARSEAKRLLSDHAPVGVRPQVQLELTVRGRRMRLVRSPEYERVKRRGTGTTKEHAKASLTWVDEPGSEGITRLDEIGEAVAQSLGMSAEQFFQVVLLPQGEFARFLRASTEERAQVLKRLFDTARFGDVEKWFSEQRKASAAQVEQAKSAQAVLLGKLATAAGVDDHGADDVDPLGWARDLAESADTECVRHDVELATAETTTAAARVVLAAATKRADVLDRRRRAQRELTRLDAERPQRAAREHELAEAESARAAVVAAADAAEAHQLAEQQTSVADQLCVAVRADVDGAREADGDLGRAVADWRAEIGGLTELVGLADRTECDTDQLATLQGTATEHEDALSKLDTQRAALPAERESAEARLVRARGAAELLPTLAGELERAVSARRAGAELPDVRVRARAAQDAKVAATRTHLDARQYWLELRERRLDGMATELASTLHDGQPCPVCGSAEHPEPAQRAGEHVGRAQEVAAHEAEQQAATSAQDAGELVHELARQVDALIQQSADRPLDVLQAEEATARAADEHAQREAADTDAARQWVAELHAQHEQLDADARALRGTAAAAAERCRSMQERIADAQRRLAAARGDDADVRVRSDRLTRLVAAAQELLDARRAADTARGYAEERHDKAARAAVQAGFADLAAALAAGRPEASLCTLRAELEGAQEAEAGARAVLVEPDVVATPDVDVDLAAPQQACEAADAALGQAQGAAADAQRKRTEVRKLLAELAALDAKLGPALERHRELAALADVINGLGQNSRRMSLHAYVLAARLEEVADVASIRLRRMSGDRYEFVHSDAPGSNGKRGGLGLDIRDDYTGAVRSAKTLSGGEAFLASLALALGLADVVAAEAGGVLLDTLFIDEGFGSLDAGTLEEVMAVLDDLRAGGRVVGLVSHVDELRQRIPNRLMVHKGRNGSHLELSSA